jgi:hypothetical protein
MGLLYGRAGRLNTKNGGFRPGQWAIEPWGLIYKDRASYSDMVELPDGKIAVVFERSNSSLEEYRYVSIAIVKPSWATAAADDTEAGAGAGLRLKTTDSAAVLSLLLLRGVSSQYAYHSKSPDGPWAPINVATGDPSVTLPPGDIWFGPNCQRKGNSSTFDPLACGGNNPSPYFVDQEAAAATGFAAGTVIIATTWSANQSYDGEPQRTRSSISVGICKSWKDACDIHPQSLFHFPHQVRF